MKQYPTGKPADRQSSKYVYEDIADRLRQRILAGEWAPGSRLPTVDQLSLDCPASKVTVNKAIQLLQEQGILLIRRGVGIFVQRPERQVRFGLLIGQSLTDFRQSPFAALVAHYSRELIEEREQLLKIYVENRRLLHQGIPNNELQDDLRADHLTCLISAHCDAPKVLEQSRVWQEKRIPIVDLSGHQNIRHRIVNDGLKALELSIAYAAQQKRRQIAFLDIANHGCQNEVQQLCQKHGIALLNEWHNGLSMPSSEESGYTNIMSVWQRKNRPDALMIFDDTVAKGAMQGMLKLGINHPDDLLLMSCVNKGADMFFPMPFVRIVLDTREMVAEAIKLLDQLRENPSLPPKEIKIRPRLQARKNIPDDIVL